MADEGQKSKAIREWIIFTLSIGLGAHIVLGLMLHSPERWPLRSLWIYGILISVSVYIVVQVIRSVWWLVKSAATSHSSHSPHQ